MNVKKTMTAGVAGIALLASACAAPPMGPTIAVMPPPNKPMELFQHDSSDCQGYAQGIVKASVDQANQQMAGQVIFGALLGAALGGAAGGARAIGAGAAAGAVVGTAVAADGAPWAQLSIQQQYDIAFAQCMYSRGDQVPGYTQQYALPPPPPPPPHT
jgi:uncharacterized protein YcfJ